MNEDVVEELETLVSFQTISDPLDKRANLDCAQYIGNRLDESGFISELIEFEGYNTVYGRYGQGEFKILFLAHLDVVPVGEGWDSDPFKLRVDGDIAYGRGSSDNKGNIVSLLLLADRLKESAFPCTIIIAASGDEEIGGRNGAFKLKEHLVKRGLFPDYTVITDSIGQQIIHRRRNVLPTYIKAKKSVAKMRGKAETIRFETDVFGSTSRHSAYMRPSVDRHAMLAASKYLDVNPYTVVKDVRGAFLKSNVVPGWIEVDLLHPDESGPESEYDVALTGLMRALLPLSNAAFPTQHSDHGRIISPNLLSVEGDLWTLYCDIRAMTNDAEAVERAIQRALEGRVDLFSLRVSPGAGYVDTDPNSRLIRAARWALEKEQIPYRVIEGYGASDSRFFAGEGCDLFDFGPRGGNTHGPNEWVSISSIKENADFYHALIDVLLRKPGGL
ncbi:MAG: M20/M25/M40 family metallo-hydrolase [Candidatus Thorarchaeota archaeon]